MLGGMQLIKYYKGELDPNFLKYYSGNFKNSRMVYIHWSAGYYSSNSTHYHKVIALSDSQLDYEIQRLHSMKSGALGPKELKSQEKKVFDLKYNLFKPTSGVTLYNNASVDVDMYEHTYRRNSNSCGIAIASMYGGNTQNLGECEPLPIQLQELVRLCSEICLAKRIPVGNFMSHAEAADNVDYNNPYATDALHEPYGPKNGCERWDFWCWVNPTTLELKAPQQKCPEGWLPFMDWLRGEVIRNVQKVTEKYWKNNTNPDL